MTAQAGDRIVMRAKTKRVAPSARSGVIEQVLSASQPRYLVRWDDGRTTVIAPAGGSILIEPAAAKKAPAKKTRAKA